MYNFWRHLKPPSSGEKCGIIFFNTLFLNFFRPAQFGVTFLFLIQICSAAPWGANRSEIASQNRSNLETQQYLNILRIMNDFFYELSSLILKKIFQGEIFCCFQICNQIFSTIYRKNSNFFSSNFSLNDTLAVN